MPKKISIDLMQGKNISPEAFHNVPIFFSDIGFFIIIIVVIIILVVIIVVIIILIIIIIIIIINHVSTEKFTTFASQKTPLEVFRMINRLYKMMDYLVSCFPTLFKVETIGDAFVVYST